MPTPDDTFDLLADAAGVRYPQPERENRGLCPAHDDHNNPGLVFKISPTTGNLLAHCFAQECSVEDIATSIGVGASAFFVGGSGTIRVPVEWTYLPFLELLKMLPLGYSWDEQIEAVFRTLDVDLDNDIRCLNLPYHEVPWTVARDVLLYTYCLPHWKASAESWWGDEGLGYADKAMRAIAHLSGETKTNDLTQESPIPGATT
jgi:hypothetical protein